MQALAMDAYPRIALSSCGRYTLPVGERWVNPLPDEAPRAKWEPEKNTRFAGLFFLTSLRPVLPLGQCPPSKTVCVVAPTLQLLTISLAKPFLLNTT